MFTAMTFDNCRTWDSHVDAHKFNNVCLFAFL